MNTDQGLQAYKTGSIENAPPLKLVRMLYQGALRFIEQAERAAQGAAPGDGPPVMFFDTIARADAIVSELRLALDPEHAPEIAANLESLYLFVESGLQQAQAERSAAPLAAVRQVLLTLLEGWTEVESGRAA